MADDVDLGSRFEAMMDLLLQSGRYGTREEVLREGVRLLSEREARLATLDAAIERGIADADAGRVHGIDEVFERLHSRYSTAAKAG